MPTNVSEASAKKPVKSEGPQVVRGLFLHGATLPPDIAAYLGGLLRTRYSRLMTNALPEHFAQILEFMPYWERVGNDR